MTKRPAPTALPVGLTREDVLYYICEAIEGAPSWARSDEHMMMLVDEMMTSQDIYATLKRYIPDAEWKDAYTLISTKAPHHEYYRPQYLPTSALNSLKGAIEAQLKRTSPMNQDGQFSVGEVLDCANRCAHDAGLSGIFWKEDLASWLMAHYTGGTAEGYSFMLVAVTPARFTVTVAAIGERATILKADGEATSTSFTGTESECLAWVASQHGELAGRSRKPAATLVAAQAAWSRAGFADEWELTYRAA